MKPGYATVGRIDEITNAPIHENLDDSLKLCEKQIYKNTKLEVGRDGVNACKAMGYDENEQLDNPKITEAEMSVLNDTPASKQQPLKDLMPQVVSLLISMKCPGLKQKIMTAMKT